MSVSVFKSAPGARIWACWLLCALVLAAPGHAAEPAVGDAAKANGQQQRRAALRAALQAQRDADAPKPDRAVRQLTPAERAKLRDQLREQRRDALPARNR